MVGDSSCTERKAGVRRAVEVSLQPDGAMAATASDDQMLLVPQQACLQALEVKSVQEAKLHFAAQQQHGRASTLGAGSKGRNRAAHPQRLAQLLVDIVAEKVAGCDNAKANIQDFVDQQAPEISALKAADTIDDDVDGKTQDLRVNMATLSEQGSAQCATDTIDNVDDQIQDNSEPDSELEESNNDDDASEDIDESAPHANERFADSEAQVTLVMGEESNTDLQRRAMVAVMELKLHEAVQKQVAAMDAKFADFESRAQAEMQGGFAILDAELEHRLSDTTDNVKVEVHRQREGKVPGVQGVNRPPDGHADDGHQQRESTDQRAGGQAASLRQREKDIQGSELDTEANDAIDVVKAEVSHDNQQAVSSMNTAEKAGVVRQQLKEVRDEVSSKGALLAGKREDLEQHKKDTALLEAWQELARARAQSAKAEYDRLVETKSSKGKSKGKDKDMADIKSKGAAASKGKRG